MRPLIRITSILMLLLLSSCAARLANASRDAQQPFYRAKPVQGEPLEEQVRRCLKQSDGQTSPFKVTRVIKLTRRPLCGLGWLSSVMTLGIWPNVLPAPYIADVEGTIAGKIERRKYRLCLDQYHSVLLWLCPVGREDIQLARALSGAVQRGDIAAPYSLIKP